MFLVVICSLHIAIVCFRAVSKVNGGMATTSLRRAMTLQPPPCINGPARVGKLVKVVPPPPPPPAPCVSFHGGGGNPPNSSYCRYHCLSASGSSGSAAPAAGCPHRCVSRGRKSATLDRRASPASGRGVLSGMSSVVMTTSPSSSITGGGSLDDTLKRNKAHTSVV